jgi:hypothetical protein
VVLSPAENHECNLQTDGNGANPNELTFDVAFNHKGEGFGSFQPAFNNVLEPTPYTAGGRKVACIQMR